MNWRLSSMIAAMLMTVSCASAQTTAPVTTDAPFRTGLILKTTQPPLPATTSTLAHKETPACDGDIIFEHPPVDLEAVDVLVPFGLMTGSHVTPVDHQYLQNFVEPDRRIDVYSPGTGRVVSIQHFGAPVAEDSSGLVDDFRLVIEHTCTISSIFIHIDELIPRLAEHDPGIGNYASVDVQVGAGELIGTFTENVDYNVVDLDFTADGFINPASYQQEPWKIHVPDTFEYFTSEIRSRMESLSLRTAAPRGGRFAYDIDGRLVGNWFQEGTNGYGGADPERYWAGHLAFAYDYIDPSTIIVSIGTFIDRSRQFAVLGNNPDPAEVSVQSGMIVYDLVSWDYFVGDQLWDRLGHAGGLTATPGDIVEGAIAIQLVDDRSLLVEVLPGHSSADITEFGPNALIYTR